MESITYTALAAVAVGTLLGLLLGLWIGELRAGRAYRRGVADEHERSGGCWVRQQAESVPPPGIDLDVK